MHVDRRAVTCGPAFSLVIRQPQSPPSIIIKRRDPVDLSPLLVLEAPIPAYLLLQVLELLAAPDLRAGDLLLPAQPGREPGPLPGPLLPLMGPRPAPRAHRPPPRSVPHSPDSQCAAGLGSRRRAVRSAGLCRWHQLHHR